MFVYSGFVNERYCCDSLFISWKASSLIHFPFRYSHSLRIPQVVNPACEKLNAFGVGFLNCTINLVKVQRVKAIVSQQFQALEGKTYAVWFVNQYANPGPFIKRVKIIQINASDGSVLFGCGMPVDHQS